MKNITIRLKPWDLEETVEDGFILNTHFKTYGGCIGNKICVIVINPAFESHYCKTLNILFVPHVFQ